MAIHSPRNQLIISDLCIRVVHKLYFDSRGSTVPGLTLGSLQSARGDGTSMLQNVQ